MLFPRDIAAAFTISELRITNSGRDENGRVALAKAKLMVGPVEFPITIQPDGRVVMPHEIRDRNIDAAVRHSMRAMTLEAIATAFSATTGRETRLAQAYAENMRRYLEEAGQEPPADAAPPKAWVPAGKTIH